MIETIELKKTVKAVIALLVHKDVMRPCEDGKRNEC